jgi:hypothetical protein
MNKQPIQSLRVKCEAGFGTERCRRNAKWRVCYVVRGDRKVYKYLCEGHAEAIGVSLAAQAEA